MKGEEEVVEGEEEEESEGSLPWTSDGQRFLHISHLILPTTLGHRNYHPYFTEITCEIRGPEHLSLPAVFQRLLQNPANPAEFTYNTVQTPIGCL